MHLKRLSLKHIRSIRELNISFPEKGNAAGWHVIIGGNGTGKTSILRSIALCFIGPDEILRLDPNWETWVRQKKERAELEFEIERHAPDIGSGKGAKKQQKEIAGLLSLESVNSRISLRGGNIPGLAKYLSPEQYVWGSGKGWFSCAFGAYRRFSGGTPSLDQHFVRNPKIAAHLTVFKEDAALTESVVWLKDIHTRRLQANGLEYERLYQALIHFVNRAGLLPEGFKFLEVNADGPFFSDPNEARLHLFELSDGIRSVLSLTLELLRLMITTFSIHDVFGDKIKGESENEVISVFGVVLIDEIDAHLHPTWQTRIGNWFTKNFPNIQFIVTTHSPLICRAAEKGTIWHLRNEDGETKCREVVGVEKDKLVYGNILDAAGTELFGESAIRSERAMELLEEYAQLETRAIFNKLAPKDQLRFDELKSMHLV